jgi:predicted nucleotidyltransferase
MRWWNWRVILLIALPEIRAKFGRWPEIKDVQDQLETVVSRFHEILKTNLVGVYLHGSLAMGCFNLQRSDIDLLVLTRRTLTPRIRATVARAFLSLSRSPAPVELSVVKRTDLCPWRHPCPYDFHFSESWRGDYERFLADPAHIWVAPESGDPDLAGHITVLRARGKVLYGPPIEKAFPEIPRADFLDSILGDVLSHEFGIPSETIPPVYMILNVCRTLVYLRTGQILSKAEGGVWALENIPPQPKAVVEAALAAYRADGNDQTLEAIDLQPFREWSRGVIRLP